MPRARIPYDELQKAAEEKYPYPAFRYVTVLRRSRYDNVPSPTVVYDRSTGNYKKMGFKCQVTMEVFDGLAASESSWLGRSRWNGYQTEYKPVKIIDVLEPVDI